MGYAGPSAFVLPDPPSTVSMHLSPGWAGLAGGARREWYYTTGPLHARLLGGAVTSFLFWKHSFLCLSFRTAVSLLMFCGPSFQLLALEKVPAKFLTVLCCFPLLCPCYCKLSLHLSFFFNVPPMSCQETEIISEYQKIPEYESDR